MVVGDRLWLFSQTPNGPVHQSLVMPPTAPQLTTLRPLIPNQGQQQLVGAGRPGFYGRHLMSSMPRLPISPYSRGLPGSFNPHLPFDARAHQQQPLLLPKEEYQHCTPKVGANSGTSLADLERAFGSRSGLIMNRNSYPVDCDRVSENSGAGETVGNDESAIQKYSDTESEIDCEQVDE